MGYDNYSRKRGCQRSLADKISSSADTGYVRMTHLHKLCYSNTAIHVYTEKHEKKNKISYQSIFTFIIFTSFI